MRSWLIMKRKEKGKTQLQVAQEAGIARSYLTRIENGDYKVPVETAMRISKVLEFDWTEFYREEEEKIGIIRYRDQSQV